MQTLLRFQRTCNFTDEGPSPKHLERNSNHKTALSFIIFCWIFPYLLSNILPYIIYELYIFGAKKNGLNRLGTDYISLNERYVKKSVALL